MNKSIQPDLPAFQSGHQKTITYSRVLHLGHVIEPNIPQWPGDPPVEFETVASLEKDGYYLRRFCMGEHSATHINAPNSFHPDGMGIDQYPAESLVVPAVVIDIRAQAAANPDYALTIAEASNPVKTGSLHLNSRLLHPTMPLFKGFRFLLGFLQPMF